MLSVRDHLKKPCPIFITLPAQSPSSWCMRKTRHPYLDSAVAIPTKPVYRLDKNGSTGFFFLRIGGCGTDCATCIFLVPPSSP